MHSGVAEEHCAATEVRPATIAAVFLTAGGGAVRWQSGLGNLLFEFPCYFEDIRDLSNFDYFVIICYFCLDRIPSCSPAFQGVAVRLSVYNVGTEEVRGSAADGTLPNHGD